MIYRGIMNYTKNASTLLEKRVLRPVSNSDKMLEAVGSEETIDYAYNIHLNTVPSKLLKSDRFRCPGMIVRQLRCRLLSSILSTRQYKYKKSAALSVGTQYSVCTLSR